MREFGIYLVRDGSNLLCSMWSTGVNEGGFGVAGFGGGVPSLVESHKADRVLNWYRNLFGADLGNEDDVIRITDGDVCYIKSGEHKTRPMNEAQQNEFDSIWALLMFRAVDV